MATTRAAATKKVARKVARPAPATALVPPRQALPGPAKDGLVNLARDLRSFTDFVLGIAGTAADLSFKLAAQRLTKPTQQAAVRQAGNLFRELREGAGLTLAELGRAINLKDLSALEAAEGGKVGLPFEIILRLASVLGRKDPVTMAMKLTRSYNPSLWAALEGVGIGKLAVQAGREREFANIYRASDAARDLSDAEFAALVQWIKASLDMALAFRAQPSGADAGQ